MSQDYLKSWTFLSKEMQKPFQAMMELNIRALKDFRYFKIEELSQIRQPADLMGKQVSLAMENSHKMLNYMQESFHIMEHALLELSNELRDNSAKTMKLAGNDLFKNKMMMPADLMQEMMKAQGIDPMAQQQKSSSGGGSLPKVSDPTGNGGGNIGPGAAPTPGQQGFSASPQQPKAA